VPEISRDEAAHAVDRAKQDRYSLMETRGALAKRPTVVVSSRQNPTLAKAARQQEVEAATAFAKARSTASATLAQVAPIKADLDAERDEIDRERNELENAPEELAYQRLSEERHDAFSRLGRVREGTPEYEEAKAAKIEIVARHAEMQATRGPIQKRFNRILDRAAIHKLWIPKVTMAVSNLSNEVETALSPTFEGWNLSDDSPEVRQELTEAIAEGEKSAQADVQSERRTQQQAVARADSGQTSGGGAGRTAALGLLGAGVGAVGVGLLGAVVGGIAGTFLGSTGLGAAVGAGAGALLGGLIGGGIGLGVGALSGRKRGGSGGGASAGAAGDAAQAAQEPQQDATAARDQDQQQEEAVAQVQGEAPGANGSDRGLEDSDEPRSKLAGPRGGATPRAARRGLTWAEDAENPDLVATHVQDFDAEEYEHEKRVPWSSMEYGSQNPDKFDHTKGLDPYTAGGYGLYPKGQPRRSEFFENESRSGRETLEEQKRRAPSAFENAPEPDADEWR